MTTKRVLIVDDALIMRARIRNIALESGWDIAGEAADGEEAVQKYQELGPDLVTMDIVMPRLDGVAALSRIRDLDSSARIVMITAIDQKEKLTRCISLGALDFIVKPFEKEVLQSFFQKYAE